MWEYLTLRRAEEKRIRDDAAREKQEGTNGQWQRESQFKEILEHARRNEDMECSSEIMCRSYDAMRNIRCEELKEECIEKKGKSFICMGLKTTRDANEKVVKEEAGRLGIVRKLLRKHGLPEANHCASGRKWRSHVVVHLPELQKFSSGSSVCPRCRCFPLDDHTWWVSTGHGDGNK